MKNKITMLLTNEYNPDVRVYKEATYLVSKGWEITILCWNRNPSNNLPGEETNAGIHIVRFPIPSRAGSGMRQLPAFLRYIKICKKYLKTHPCDFLHCHDIDGAITGYLARKNKTPMVFDMHEFYEHGNRIVSCAWRKLTLFLLGKSKAAVTVGKQYLSLPYTKACSKIYLLPNYPDKNIIEALPKRESSVFRVCYNGAVRYQIPEFTALFEAMKDLPDVRVDINGGGTDLPILKELEHKYVNVHINGYFDGSKELSRLYADTDVLFCGYNVAIPNHKSECEPVKFYEAIFTGTPMIVPRGMYIGSKVKENCFGITCDTRNAAEIKAAVLKLKDDHAFWRICQKNELNNAYRYDWGEAVKVLDEIYGESRIGAAAAGNVQTGTAVACCPAKPFEKKKG